MASSTVALIVMVVSSEPSCFLPPIYVVHGAKFDKRAPAHAHLSTHANHYSTRANQWSQTLSSRSFQQKQEVTSREIAQHVTSNNEMSLVCFGIQYNHSHGLIAI